MTRRRSSAPGVRSPRVLRVLIPLVVVLVAACGGTTATTPPAAAPETETPVTTPGLQTQAPSTEPLSPEPAPSAAATPDPATEEPTSEPEPTDAPAEGACTGNDENLAFYAEFAVVVDWTVYCPALPRGWFVGTGQWRQADGGRLEISYRGPNGAGLMLQEGSFCPGEGDCVPGGEDLGPTPFGDRDATLVATADGWAIVVGRGERPSWLLTVTGVDEAGARAIAADLVSVGG